MISHYLYKLIVLVDHTYDKRWLSTRINGLHLAIKTTVVHWFGNHRSIMLKSKHINNKQFNKLLLKNGGCQFKYNTWKIWRNVIAVSYHFQWTICKLVLVKRWLSFDPFLWYLLFSINNLCCRFTLIITI